MAKKNTPEIKIRPSKIKELSDIEDSSSYKKGKAKVEFKSIKTGPAKKFSSYKNIKNIHEEKFKPLPEAKEFSTWNRKVQNSSIEKRIDLIEMVSADKWEKAANYFFILKSKKIDFGSAQTIRSMLSLARRIPDGCELDLMKVYRFKEIKKNTDAIVSILRNMGRNEEIKKSDFNTIKKIINKFFSDNSYEEKKSDEEKNLDNNTNTKVENISDTAKKLLSGLKTEKEKIKQATEEFEIKSQEFKQKTQESLKELQTKTNLSIFADEAEIFKSAANRYFIRAVIFLLGAGASFYSLYNIARYELYETHYILKEVTIGKTLLVFLLLTALGICMRGYFLNSHNEAHNRHRSNVLRSYKNIYENTDKEDRKEVVTQTLSAAFQQLPTGFSKQQGESGAGGLGSLLSRFLP